MPLTKDDIDAVSMMLHVDGELAFSILLTRGGLTQRIGSSDAIDRAAVMVKGRTDRCFEDFLTTLPAALLDRGGRFEDGGRDGPRHDWRFEFGGGVQSLAYDIAYHHLSASLPDEFADVVVQAERLTHSWWVAGVAEETGQPVPAATAPAPEPPSPAVHRTPPRGTPAPRRVPASGGQPLPVTRERIALAVLLDMFAFTIPYSFLHWLFVGGEGSGGRPGAGLVLFAILEFVLLQIARRSPGYWLLGISAPLGEKPRVDPAWPARESNVTLAVGIVLCGLGVRGLTAWTTYHTPVPYFGLPFPLWLSLPLTLLGGIGFVLAGALVLRLDLRGVWLGGGLALLLLFAGAAGWDDWGRFVETALANRGEYLGRPPSEGLLGLGRGAVPVLMVLVPGLCLAGLYECWKRWGRRPVLAGAGAVKQS